MPAPANIPFAANDPSGFQVPAGLTATQTPQGGSAFKDASGNMYIKGTNGYTLAPTTLPANNYQAPGPGQGLNPVPNAAPAPNIQVQPAPLPAGTPTPTASTAGPTPGTAVTGTPAVVTAPIMPPSVQTGIETSANAETEALGSGVPTTTSTPSITSVNTQPNINDYLGALPPAPVAPDLNADQTAEENTVGIPAIQTNISNLQSQLLDAQNQVLATEAGEASKPGVVASVINGRIKMISAEDAVAINNLNGQIKTAQAQLTAANTVVATYMKNDQSSYTDASAAYEKAYTDAMAQYTDAEKQANFAETTARANITALTASFKGKTGYTITPDDTAAWNALDLQAGFAPGTTQAIVQNDLNVSKFIKGSNGTEYAITTDANGNPQVVQIGSVGGTTAQANSGLPTTAQKNAAVGIPSAGSLTKAQYTKLQGLGVTQGQADGIVTSLLAGDSLETIRQNIKAAGGDPAILDYFNNAVGISTITKTTP